MLALVGLLGILFAGVVAEAAIVMATEPDEDDTPTELPDEPEGDSGSAIDWVAEDVTGGASGKVDIPDGDTDSAAVGRDNEASAESLGSDEEAVSESDDENQAFESAANYPVSGGQGYAVIDPESGDNYVLGGSGDDTLNGGAGADVLHGAAGDDTLRGDEGDDALFGHEGDDLLVGGPGADTLSGGEGEDSLAGGSGEDWLAGGWGDDVLHGGEGNDTVDGGYGNDLVFGARDGAADFLNGGEGDDLLLAGAEDVATGGGGSDSFALSDWSDGETPARIEDFDATTDEIVVVYDPDQHPDPTLTFNLTADGSGTMVMLDGIPVAEVSGVTDLLQKAIRLTTVMPMAA